MAYYTKQDFDDDYEIPVACNTSEGSKRITLHYNRASILPLIRARVAKMIDMFDLAATDKILIVGCGFGWSIEAFKELGFNDVWGTEVSDHVSADVISSEQADIEAAITLAGYDPLTGIGAEILADLDTRFGFNRAPQSPKIIFERGDTAESIAAISTACGGSPDWLFVEDVAPCVLEESAIGIRASCMAINPENIVHCVTPYYEGTEQKPEYNWKTIEEWSVLFSGDKVLNLNTFEVYP